MNHIEIYRPVTAPGARTLKMIERSGRRTVPQIFIDDQAIDGFDELSKINLTDKLDQAHFTLNK